MMETIDIHSAATPPVRRPVVDLTGDNPSLLPLEMQAVRNPPVRDHITTIAAATPVEAKVLSTTFTRAATV